MKTKPTTLSYGETKALNEEDKMNE